MSTEFRLEQVERRLDRMSKRVRELELELELGGPGETSEPRPWTPPVSPPVGQPPQTQPPPRPTQALPPLSQPRQSVDFEALFGGRVLAWVGGLAILLGAVLFLGMAISRDWIDEVTRTLIAVFGSLSLLGVGVWLEEAKGRTDAARVAAACGIFGLFATLVVATQTYELISTSTGFVLAALIAAAGMGLAVRWSSEAMAAIGALGALAAPILVGTGGDGSSLGFVFMALVAVTAIVVWQRWGWLVLGAFAVSAPQLLAWVNSVDFNSEGAPVGLILGLLIFYAVYLVGAFGYELRSKQQGQLPLASLLQLFASTALVVATGYHVFDSIGADNAAIGWLFGSSLMLVVLGLLALLWPIHREIGSLLIGLGLGISALGFAVALSGPALVIAWAAEGAILAYLATFLENEENPVLSSAERLLFVAGAFVGVALAHTLIFEAPPKALFEGVEELGSAVAAVGACAAAALALGFVIRRLHPAALQYAGFAAGALLVYLGSILIVDTIGVDATGESRQVGQVWLSVFWTVTGLGALVWGLVRDSAPVRLGGLALLGIAITKVWTYDLSELDELARVLSFVGLGLLLLVGAFAYQRIKPGREADQRQPQDSR